MDAGKEKILLLEKNRARINVYCLWLVHSSGAIHFTSKKYNLSRPEPEFVNILGAQETIPSLMSRYDN